METPTPSDDVRRPPGRTVLIGFNPQAGARDPRKRERVERLCAALGEEGLESKIVSDRDALAAEAAEQHRQGTLRAIVAAGGDGTASDLVNRTEPGVPFALLALGTENLLARHLGMPRDPAAVAHLIAAGHAMAIDVGRANGRLFLLMAGCGFDADVVRRLHATRIGHITQWSYAKHILAAVRNYQYPQFQVTCRLSGRDFETPIEHSLAARWAFVTNLPKYAGGLCFSPGAAGDDGRLDLCAFQGGSFWSGLRYLLGVMVGRHPLMSDCVTAQATQIMFAAAEPVPYQLDGDPGGWLPLTIDVLPRRMTLLAPRPH